MMTTRSDGDPTFTVGIVFPMSGSFGLVGPSSELSAQLAQEELNATDGILGRRVELLPIDGGRDPAVVAADIRDLLDAGALDAVAGLHTSAVRRALIPITTNRIPYVYTSLYEGGDRYPGLFVTGETPSAQIVPALDVMVDEMGRRQWAVVGNDYVWPRKTAAIVTEHLHSIGASVVFGDYRPIGTVDYSRTVSGIEQSGCDGVVVLLLGDDAVAFHQAFAATGLDRRCVRLSPLMDENMLLATGAENIRELYVSSGYFETLGTSESLDFSGRFSSRFGVDAPIVGSLGQSCYEGITMLGELVDRAGSAEVAALESVAQDFSYDGARGHLAMANGHVTQPIYLAKAGEVDFDVLTRITPRRRS
ncbi:substrate-binding domain-containing protein [Rhodococcoides kyotonense]|uniref:ABC-type branched-chain amino acid transport system, substrate-binding protein n=1 Tax=Rhodococcoides kyotonense TaxID=398843 RepID=A0A239L1Z1_9NOCA|nr:substrate-binding domain-containing protein [Rhodococcus kyotonensis]SNT23564.1 ABC-type branched-chain amino acid transport system, substrate-binding protein [Rhodococcus kyotonensis]